MKINKVHEPIPQHIPAKRLKGMMGEEVWGSCFSFAFIRNPWSWVVSRYCYRRQKIGMGKINSMKRTMKVTKDKTEKNRISAGIQSTIDAQKMGFPHWAKKHAHHMMIPKEGIVKASQLFWIMDKRKVLVDFVGKQENLNNDFQYACKKIGLPPVDLLHINDSKHIGYRDYYDKNLRKYIGKVFKEDIEFGGYEF